MEGQIRPVFAQDIKERSEQDKKLFLQFLKKSYENDQIEFDKKPSFVNEEEEFQKHICYAIEMVLPDFHNRTQVVSDRTEKSFGGKTT